MSNLILINIEDQIATLTFNRPEKLNALNYATNDYLLKLLDDLEHNNEVRALILTGSGDRAFSAGGDIHEFTNSIKENPEQAINDFCKRGQKMTARLEDYPKPIIAAINGIAFGGGCEITEACHLAIASEKAIFAKPEINIGIPPTFGGTQRLPRLAGRKRALELLLTGDQFSPVRAYEMGLINKVVSHENLQNEAVQLAKRILRHSPLAAARIITAVTRGINTTIAEGLSIEKEQFARMLKTKDVTEGLNAWIDRRTPNYSGQ